MDSLDFAIYRFLAPAGEARFWAGRRIIDPTITPREISERVGISESGVRTRLGHLAERGFLRDKAVIPNPSLFGMQVFVTDLLVHQSGEVDRLLHDLSLVEGVVFTRDLMDEEERKIQVHFVSESESTAARHAALMGRLSPTGEPALASPYYIPPCGRELSPLGWRALAGVWQRPDTTIAELSKTVGVTLKTAARSYHQLLESRACWWTHGPSSEEFPLALVSVDLRTPGDREAVAGWVVQEIRNWIPVADDGLGFEPAESTTVLAGLVPADAPTVLERFLRKLAGVDGVAKIRRTFPLGSATYTSWFGERIDERLRGRG